MQDQFGFGEAVVGLSMLRTVGPSPCSSATDCRLSSARSIKRGESTLRREISYGIVLDTADERIELHMDTVELTCERAILTCERVERRRPRARAVYPSRVRTPVTAANKVESASGIDQWKYADST